MLKIGGEGCIIILYKVKHILYTSIVNNFWEKCYNVYTSRDGEFCYTPHFKYLPSAIMNLFQQQ